MEIPVLVADWGGNVVRQFYPPSMQNFSNGSGANGPFTGGGKEAMGSWGEPSNYSNCPDHYSSDCPPNLNGGWWPPSTYNLQQPAGVAVDF